VTSRAPAAGAPRPGLVTSSNAPPVHTPPTNPSLRGNTEPRPVIPGSITGDDEQPTSFRLRPRKRPLLVPHVVGTRLTRPGRRPRSRSSSRRARGSSPNTGMTTPRPRPRPLAQVA
jgi:hypothetical protein